MDVDVDATHHDDGVLDEGLGSDQLVVAGVVHHVEDTSLAGAHCVGCWFAVVVVAGESRNNRKNAEAREEGGVGHRGRGRAGSRRSKEKNSR